MAVNKIKLMLTEDQQKQAIELFKVLKEAKKKQTALKDIPELLNKEVSVTSTTEAYYKATRYADIIAKEIKAPASKVRKVLIAEKLIKTWKKKPKKLAKSAKKTNTKRTNDGARMLKNNLITKFDIDIMTKDANVVDLGILFKFKEKKSGAIYNLHAKSVSNGKDNKASYFIYHLRETEQSTEKINRPYINGDTWTLCGWLKDSLYPKGLIWALLNDGFDFDNFVS